MKIQSLWYLAAAIALCGCESESQFTYQQPLTSPGAAFATLPPAVQNSVRAEGGMAEISAINKEAAPGVYEILFRNFDVYPPLYIASDGSVLSSNMTTVAVGASEDSIAASTGSELTGLRMDDLPAKVVQTIRVQGPTAEVESISRLTSQGEVFYSVSFKDPLHHLKVLIRDDGKLVQ